MNEEELKQWFEERFLKNTCFHSYDDLMTDRTSIQVNAPRALIAVELKGVWRGLLSLKDINVAKKGTPIERHEQIRNECWNCGNYPRELDPEGEKGYYTCEYCGKTMHQ